MLLPVFRLSVGWTGALNVAKASWAYIGVTYLRESLRWRRPVHNFCVPVCGGTQNRRGRMQTQKVATPFRVP